MKEIIFVENSLSFESGQVFDGKDVVFTGAKRLTDFEKENGVYVCDLLKTGATLHEMRSRGYNRSLGGGHSELFIGGKPCNVSRYPKKGEFCRISAYVQSVEAIDDKESGNLETGFYFEDERPKQWAEDKNIWMHGYWGFDWANSYEQIEVFDKEKGFIVAKPPYGNFFYRVGQRFHFLNVKEEVTEAGDYYLDFERKRVYFLPFEEGKTEDVWLSVTKEPCIHLVDKENVVIENCVIENFTGNGVLVENCKNILFRNCIVRNIGGCGAIVKDSENVVFENCDVYHVGDCGLKISGGDRKTLTSCNCGVKNCQIHDVSAWSRTYTPAIWLVGVGMFAKNNQIYDCPHAAILYWGNEIKITDNTIYDVMYETHDAGAIYSGRDYTCRGNEVSDNLICLTGGYGPGTMGIYNDDGLSGTKIERNVFYKVQRAIYLGGGVDYVVRDNVLVDCTPAVDVDGRCASKHKQWRENVRTLKEWFYNVRASRDFSSPKDDENPIYVGIAAIDEPYRSRYPELMKLHELFSSSEALPFIYPSGEVTGNVIWGGQMELCVTMITREDFERNFKWENNRTVTCDSELKEAVPKKLYEKYLHALELEKGLKQR